MSVLVGSVDTVLKETKNLLRGFSTDRGLSLGYWLYEPTWYQRLWWESDKQMKLVLSGNRTGKTFTLVEKVGYEGTEQKPEFLGGKTARFKRGHLKGKRILVAGETFESLKSTVLPHIQALLPEEMWDGPPKLDSQTGMWRERKFASGAVLVFKSYEQALKNQEGGRWDFIGLDEPPPEKVFKALFRGCIDEGGELWVTATPLKGMWMQDVLIKPAQDPKSDLFETVDYFRVDMHDNCRECNGGHLPHKAIMTYLATLTEEERAARQKGIFLEQTGLTYGFVREDTHVVPNMEVVPFEWPVVEIIDPSATRGIWLGHFLCDPTDHWTQITAEHIADAPLGRMCDQIKYTRERRLSSTPVVALCDQRFGPHIANQEEKKTWFEKFEENGLRYEPTVNGIHEALKDWLQVPLNQRGEPMRPKLTMTRRVAQLDKGPLWATERFRYEPDQSYAQRYKQAGKDWIDLWLYLVSHPGLTFERLIKLRSVGSAKKSLAKSYATNRAGMEAHMRQVWTPKQRTKLRRAGWNIPSKRLRRGIR